MIQLIAAVVDDDATTVKKVLWNDPALASGQFPKLKLHQSGIFHWIYVGDTLLHLAVQNTGRGGSAATGRREGPARDHRNVSCRRRRFWPKK